MNAVLGSRNRPKLGTGVRFWSLILDAQFSPWRKPNFAQFAKQSNRANLYLSFRAIFKSFGRFVQKLQRFWWGYAVALILDGCDIFKTTCRLPERLYLAQNRFEHHFLAWGAEFMQKFGKLSGYDGFGLFPMHWTVPNFGHIALWTRWRRPCNTWKSDKIVSQSEVNHEKPDEMS